MKRKHKDLRHGQYLVNFYDFLWRVIGKEAIFYMTDKEYESVEKQYLKTLKGKN